MSYDYTPMSQYVAVPPQGVGSSPLGKIGGWARATVFGSLQGGVEEVELLLDEAHDQIIE